MTNVAPGPSSHHRRILRAALALTFTVAGGCDDGLALPEVDGVIWYTETERYGCDAYEEAQGEYIQSQFSHEPAGSNFCNIDRMVSNCQPVNFAGPFSFADSVSDDPGPWHREARLDFPLYDDPGGGSLLTSGSGAIDFTAITLTTGTNVGSGVDVRVGAEWSVGSYMNDAVTSAEINQFQEFLTTTATHNFPIDGTYAPRAVVSGEAWGENGGFPFLPFALSSGSFSATGTITAAFTACREVRLYNQETECIYAPGGVSAAAPCVSGSGVGVHVHQDTGDLVLLDLADFLCLTVDDTTAVAGKFPITREVCSSGPDDLQQWTWFADGTLRPLGAPGYCLAPNEGAQFTVEQYPAPVTYSPMVIQPCSSANSERWEF